jgi:FG-GAP-like repeat
MVEQMTARERHAVRRWLSVTALAVAAVTSLSPLPLSAAVAQSAPGKLGDSHRFDTWTGYEVGRGPIAVVSADFNGDGTPDVAYARHDFFENKIAVQLNAGDGTMKKAVSITATAESNDIAAGDIDRDGDQDIVVVSEGSSLTNTIIDLYVNDGTGHFTHATATGGHGAQRVALADLNGDGKADLAITNYTSQKTVSVLLGNGNGTFEPETLYTVGPNTTGIVAADLDRDGDLDLVVGWYDDIFLKSWIALLVNEGTGRFKVSKNLLLTNDSESPVVAAADFNGDGRMDLAAAGWRSDQHIVLLNRRKLSFAQTAYTAGASSTSLRAADVDADGDSDLVSATLGTTSTGTVSYLKNKGNGKFASSVSIDAGAQPAGVDVADFDGDGRPDLAVANSGATTGDIQTQRPDGTFANPPIYLGVSGQLPLDTASADFNMDGHVDMALSEIDPFSGGNDVVAIFENDGTGAMFLAQTLPSGTDSHAKSVVASDLNGDGAPDVVWTPEAFTGSYTLAISLNDGNGSFGAPATYPLASGGTGHVTTADVDGDGDQDAIVANNRGATSISISLNNGDGTFQPDYGVPMGEPQEMAIGVDLNGDGFLDLAAVDPKVDGSGRAVLIAFGKGGGLFDPPIAYMVGNGPREIAAGDFNGDGHPDLVTANEGGDDISNFAVESTSVLLNSGHGTFSSISTLLSESIPRYFNEFAVAVGDVDGNGALDIVVAHPQGQNVEVYYGNGKGAFRTLSVRYGVHSGMTDVSLADYDGDGKLDVGGPGAQNDGGIFSPGGVSLMLNLG